MLDHHKTGHKRTESYQITPSRTNLREKTIRRLKKPWKNDDDKSNCRHRPDNNQKDREIMKR